LDYTDKCGDRGRSECHGVLTNAMNKELTQLCLTTTFIL